MTKFCFGVIADTLNSASLWVERATGVKPAMRESVDLGGDYYVFQGIDGDYARLVVNNDIYDNEPRRCWR